MRSREVLVVEDEVLILIDIAYQLSDAGFVVHEAKNAAEAIAILEENPNIAVLFTDIDMPGDRDGLQLARLVRDRWPPMQIIVTSGLRSVSLQDLPIGGRFLKKPYDPRELIGMMG